MRLISRHRWLGMWPHLSRQRREVLRHNIAHGRGGINHPLRGGKPLAEYASPLLNSQPPRVRAICYARLAHRNIRPTAEAAVTRNKMGLRTHGMKIMESEIKRQTQRRGQFQNQSRQASEMMKVQALYTQCGSQRG